MTNPEQAPEELQLVAEELVFESTLEELKYLMNQRLLYYLDKRNSFDAELSFTAEALEQTGHTLYDLTKEEIDEIDELEAKLRQHLKEDNPANDEKEEIQ